MQTKSISFKQEKHMSFSVTNVNWIICSALFQYLEMLMFVDTEKVTKQISTAFVAARLYRRSMCFVKEYHWIIVFSQIAFMEMVEKWIETILFYSNCSISHRHCFLAMFIILTMFIWKMKRTLFLVLMNYATESKYSLYKITKYYNYVNKRHRQIISRS